MSEAQSTIVYKGRPSWLNYPLFYLGGILLFLHLNREGSTVAGILALFIAIAFAGMLRLRYRFIISGDWVSTRVGLIAKNTNEMQIRHIRGINVRQGIIGRILGIGTLEMLSAAEEESKVIFSGIRDPHRVKEMLKGLRE